MKLAIGIDFGGTSIKSGLVRGGEILRRGTPIDTQACGGVEATIAAMIAVVEQLRAGAEIQALGVGLPGMVDFTEGIVHELTNVAGWHSVRLRARLQERTGLPTTIENDANAMAYGEWQFGAAKSGRDVVCMTLGTGVGGGLILNGQLYRGARFGAGEIGHMSIDYRGGPGSYGNRGALESYVGNAQIAQRAQALYTAAGTAKSLQQCTPAALSQAAASGDPVAIELWAAIGLEIGTALASVIWLLNPDTIVIGGGVAKAGEILFGPIRRAIVARTLDVFHESLRIVPAGLDNDAGIIGSAALALDSLHP